MKQISRFLFAVVATLSLCISQIACNTFSLSSRISKDKIPSDTRSEVRAEIEKLYSSNEVVRAKAAQSLGSKGKGGVPAIPFLIQMLADDTQVTVENVELLSGFETEKREEGYQRKQRVTGYGQTTPGAEAMEALFRINGSALIPLLVAMCDDQDPAFRQKAEVLLEIQERKSQTKEALMDVLREALKDKRSCVRAYAVEGIGRIGGMWAKADLVLCLNDSDPTIRAKAAIAFGEAAGRYSSFRFNFVEPLISALEKDVDSNVRQEAANALEKITGERYGEDPLKWQEWWEKNKPK